jgi:ferredoxin
MGERIIIDLERCIMAGECIYNHPDHFAFGDDDLPEVLRPDINDDADRLHATQAIGVCPSGAISIVAD